MLHPGDMEDFGDILDIDAPAIGTNVIRSRKQGPFQGQGHAEGTYPTDAELGLRTYALQMQQGKIACAASKMQQVHLLGNATSESALWIGHFETKMVA
jgi:hypothetical protein